MARVGIELGLAGPSIVVEFWFGKNDFKMISLPPLAAAVVAAAAAARAVIPHWHHAV
jgi:hypothetical protein